ncbi:MSMEG_0570 family nitrogen starvation response protein [Pseudonocardia bannensis]|uniref:MSMEG_0570 family nitrogen starvation response protein n=1 Tax=Pseudonocardia bannensis TaxID=630973 RepID=A0A848DEN0_9PSEU|nr:MSMEG_0570 family nitrogen starvation response protein [Pseudonocardia bannensis]NMH91023.1 MSMEG_0570 family nitrogen starvation response protein [Pseudonocardia bannensis]
MPEVLFDTRWPDGSVQTFYSPSLIVEEYFEAGQAYPLDDFVARSRESLQLAGDRVRAKYGMGCAESAISIARIEQAAARFPDAADGTVTVERFRRWA